MIYCTSRKQATIVESVKSKLRICHLLPVFLLFLSLITVGCGGKLREQFDTQITSVGEKDNTTVIIIDDQHIKDQEYGSNLVSNIEDVFSNSFSNIHVIAGSTGSKYEKIGDVIILPKSIEVKPNTKIKGDVFKFDAYSMIEVLTNQLSRNYTFEATGVYDGAGEMSLLALPSLLFTLGVATMGQGFVYVKLAKNQAIFNIAADLHNQLVSSSEFTNYVKSVNMLKTESAKILINSTFIDSHSILPNNTIDAGEESSIKAVVTNEGTGTAFDVQLTCECECGGVTFAQTTELGNIQPGESKEVTIPIKADLSLAHGTTKFLVKAHEKRGYDARPVELQIPTAALRSPKLLLASCNINDASGLAKGNGDGRAENNETIELNPYVENQGVGEGLKVQVALKDVTEGIEVIKSSDELPLIGPGTVGRAALAFRIPRTFQGTVIKYAVCATDIRGMNTEKIYTIPFRSKTPVLQYAYQVVDSRNSEVPGLENGKTYQLKITPKNTGDNIAEDVKLTITPEGAGVQVGNYNSDVGPLQPAGAGAVMSVPISLERSFVDPSLSLNVAMEQADFPGFSKKITLPVMVKKPALEYSVALLNGVSEKALSQNSWPRFRVSINNNGNLDAKNVKVMFKVSNGELSHKKEETIGSIKAGESQYKDFTFFVRGDARVGELPVTVDIRQTDFDGVHADTIWNVVEQTAIVQKVQAAGVAQAKANARYSGPPEVFINSPIKDSKTYNETADLHGSVMTFGPGNAAERLSITLNGRPLTVIPVTEEIRLDPNQITKRVVEANKVVFDGLLILKPGGNAIGIACADRNGQTNEQRISITKMAKLGNIYAVVVGISKFGNSDYNLQYAASDAGKFSAFLKSESGGRLPEDRMKLLTDFSGTRANVIGTLTDLLGKATKEDTVVIYLATHGVTDADGSLYYLCYDTDIGNLRGTGFSDKDLTDILSRNIHAGKTIIYLDACHSGLSGLSDRYARRGIHVHEVNEKINSLAAALSRVREGGVVTFSASSSVGSSLEGPKWQGGVFTYTLINGLNGEANANNDEWVSVNELDGYLVRKVMSLTEGKQRPKVNGTLMGDTPLSKVR